MVYLLFEELDTLSCCLVLINYYTINIPSQHLSYGNSIPEPNNKTVLNITGLIVAKQNKLHKALVRYVHSKSLYALTTD